MIAKELISHDLEPLRTSDTGEEALSRMDDFHVRHLPIVNNEQLLGVLGEDDILEEDALEPIGSYALTMHRPYVEENRHLYEVMKTMADYQLTVVPVVDYKGNYMGMITLDELLRYFASIGAFRENGSIIVLEISKYDYALSEISRIVESENALILSTFITSVPDSNLLHVTLKINRQDIQHILATFGRFDYVVKASFSEADLMNDTLQERYEAFIHYMNV